MHFDITVYRRQCSFYSHLFSVLPFVIKGEAKDLCQSVGVLAAKGIKFEAVTMPMTTDLIVAIGKATELK